MILTINLGIIAPQSLGTSVVSVGIGQNKTLSTNILQDSIPPYEHISNLPIGSIKFVGHNGSKDLLFSVQNTAETIAYFTLANTRVYKSTDLNDSFTPQVVTNNYFQASSFKVHGVKIGSAYFTYVCTAIQNGNESIYSTEVGRLIVQVVNNVNTPPNACNNNTIYVPQNGMYILDQSVFLQGYNDPQGDPASKVRFDTIPQLGQTLLNGVQIQAGAIIPVQQLAQGQLVYIPAPNTPIGSVTTCNWSVSDVGTEQFYSG